MCLSISKDNLVKVLEKYDFKCYLWRNVISGLSPTPFLMEYSDNRDLPEDQGQYYVM